MDMPIPAPPRLSARHKATATGIRPRGVSLPIPGSNNRTSSIEQVIDRYPLIIGGLCIIAGEYFFASMGVGIRFVAAELPNEIIVFFRNLLGLLILAPWLVRGGIGSVATSVPGLHLLRATAGVAAMYCFFYAIAHIPLAEAMLLKLTAPIFIPLVAWLWLREEVTARVWLAIGIGFAGVLVILEPGLEHGLAGISPVALIGLSGGALAAVAKVTVRRLSRSEPTARIVFYFALIATAVSALPLTWAWQTPSLHAAGWLLVVAGCATLGQLALTTGLSLAPASRMGPFGYFSVVFGAAYGWMIWGERLSWAVAAGSALIALAGLLASRRRTRPPAGPKLLANNAAAARLD